MMRISSIYVFFFFNDTATTEIYTLSLHDALPILETRTLFRLRWLERAQARQPGGEAIAQRATLQSLERPGRNQQRSEEHTSELQSQSNLVCRLLLEKKKKTEK